MIFYFNNVPCIFYCFVLWPTTKLYFQQLHLKYFCNLTRYWLQAPWGWHDRVETCRSVTICEIIVHCWSLCRIIKLWICWRDQRPSFLKKDFTLWRCQREAEEQLSYTQRGQTFSRGVLLCRSVDSHRRFEDTCCLLFQSGNPQFCALTMKRIGCFETLVPVNQTRRNYFLNFLL